MKKVTKDRKTTLLKEDAASTQGVGGISASGRSKEGKGQTIGAPQQVEGSDPNDPKKDRPSVQVKAEKEKVSVMPEPHDDQAEDESALEDEEGMSAQSKQDVGSESDQCLHKKTQFHKYLTTAGFKYAIIRALVSLYEDDQKPDDPLAWILDFVGHTIPTQQELDTDKAEATELREKILQLQQENFELKLKIEEREEALKPDPYADYDWKKMIDELTEQGDFAQGGGTSASGGVTTASGGGSGSGEK